MAKRHSAEQWEQWISEQQKSALSVRDFCDWVGVSENAFYVWRRKLATQSPQQPDSVRSLFVPLKVISNPVIEVDLPCGAVVRVPNDEPSLQRVLGILLQSAGYAGGESREETHQ